jgi:endonuclease YncB( thermonuclease family)
MTDFDDTPDEPSEPPRGPSVMKAVGIGAGVGMALLGGLVAFVVTRGPAETAGSTTPATPAREAPTKAEAPAAQPSVALSVERQTAAKRLTGWTGDRIDLLAQEPTQPSSFSAEMVTKPPYDAIDSILFDTLDTRIKLLGVLPVARDELCIDAANRRFACGLQARASLQNFVRGKTVICRPSFGRRERRDGIVEADCRVNGISLALHQVAAGFAFPLPQPGAATMGEDEARGPLFQAMEEARAKKLGVWAGDYKPPLVDRSEADSKAVKFGATRLSQQPMAMPDPKGKTGGPAAMQPQPSAATAPKK